MKHMLRRLLHLISHFDFPAAGLFIMLLLLWGFVVLASGGRWVMTVSPFVMRTSAQATPLQAIDEHSPYRIVQPQWLSESYDGPELIIHWGVMEQVARLGVCLLLIHLLAFFTLQLVKRLIAHLSQELKV